MSIRTVSPPARIAGSVIGDELVRAGACRVYQDAADLLRNLDEVGVRAAR